MPMWKEDEKGCWNWLGTIDSEGYGRYHIGNARNRLAHRIVYMEYLNIQKIELDIKHKHIHHICENKKCVNPQHLQVLTPSDHGRLKHGRKYKKRTIHILLGKFRCPLLVKEKNENH